MGLNSESGPTHPLGRWVRWFEARGVYVPGEDAHALSTWRDFGWLITGFLLVVALFVVFFAVAS
jgi:hypothetical protein